MYQEVVTTYYKMDHPRRGLAIIFNHEIFDNSHLKVRLGTQIDNDCLTEELLILGFHVKSFQNLSFVQLIDEIEKGMVTFLGNNFPI